MHAREHPARGRPVAGLPARQLRSTGHELLRACCDAPDHSRRRFHTCRETAAHCVQAGAYRRASKRTTSSGTNALMMICVCRSPVMRAWPGEALVCRDAELGCTDRACDSLIHSCAALQVLHEGRNAGDYRVDARFEGSRRQVPRQVLHGHLCDRPHDPTPPRQVGARRPPLPSPLVQPPTTHTKKHNRTRACDLQTLAHARTHARRRTRTRTLTRTRTRRCRCTHTHARARAHTPTHTHTHSLARTHAHARTDTHTHTQ